MMLVARIDYALTRGINWLTMCLIERARGFNSTEAGDHLADSDETVQQHDRRVAESALRRFLDSGGSYTLTVPTNPEFISVQMPDGTLRTERYPQPPEASAADLERHQSRVSAIYEALHALTEPALTQTPAAAQRGENPAGVTPPTPAGSPDPSRVTVGAVRGEGSPADSDIPSSPAGERPTWVDWAVLAICDVLAEHTALVPIGDALVHCGGLDGECHSHYGDWELWREHVAGLIAERLYLASKPPLLADWPETGLDMGARIDGASEIFPQHRTTQK